MLGRVPQASHLAGPRGWRAAPGLGPLLEAPGLITAEPAGPSKEAWLAVPTGHISTADIRPAHFGGRPGHWEVYSSLRLPESAGPNVNRVRCRNTAGKDFQVTRLERGGAGWNPCRLLPGSWGVDPRLTLPSPPPPVENNRPWPGASIPGLRGARKWPERG